MADKDMNPLGSSGEDPMYDVGIPAQTTEEEDDVPVHDQLPDPEEIKTTHARSGGPSPARRRRRIFLCCGIILALVALCAILFATLPKKRYEDRLEETMDFVTQISDQEDLDDEQSPQYKAAYWLAEDDPRDYDIPDDLEDDDSWEFVQRYALVTMFYAMGGTEWSNDMRFLSDKKTCDWNRLFRNGAGQILRLGVRCDGDGKVTDIWIPNNNLKNEIPWNEIVEIGSLRKLSLESNQDIEGPISEKIDNLYNLELLALSNNILTGSVPDTMKYLKELTYLLLDDNILTGELYPLFNMPKLQYLYLEDNYFNDVIDDDFLANCPELRHLDLSGLGLGGSLPEHLFTHDNLEVLDMHDCFLKGNLPTGIGTQTNLKFLALHENNLKGPISPFVGQFRQLTHLDLSNNELTGDIAVNQGDLKNLIYLDLGDNLFNGGPIPSFLKELTELEELSLKLSNRTDNIPDWIGTLTNLVMLDLDNNYLTGNVPDSFEDLTSLTFLLLNRNDLDGEVPMFFKDLPLELLLVDNTSMTGDLNFMCTAGDRNPLDVMIADCAGDNPEITCTEPDCCRTCCSDDNPRCNDYEWDGSYEPIWEHNFERYSFTFDDRIKWVPVAP